MVSGYHFTSEITLCVCAFSVVGTLTTWRQSLVQTVIEGENSGFSALCALFAIHNASYRAPSVTESSNDKGTPFLKMLLTTLGVVGRAAEGNEKVSGQGLVISHEVDPLLSTRHLERKSVTLAD